jgi:hypothetical protein
VNRHWNLETWILDRQDADPDRQEDVGDVKDGPVIRVDEVDDVAAHDAVDAVTECPRGAGAPRDADDLGEGGVEAATRIPEMGVESATSRLLVLS